MLVGHCASCGRDPLTIEHVVAAVGDTVALAEVSGMRELPRSRSGLPVRTTISVSCARRSSGAIADDAQRE